MRRSRPLALALTITFTFAGLAGTAFALSDDGGTSAPTKSGRTSKQVSAALVRFELGQAAKTQADVDAFLKALDDRQQFLAGLAATQRAARSARASAPAAPSRPPLHGPWADLISQYPWPAATAYRIMMCESHGDANAYNARSGAVGLFQILGGPYDPAANVAKAFDMWRQRGWQPWACA